jgi:hypothetical protein
VWIDRANLCDILGKDFLATDVNFIITAIQCRKIQTAGGREAAGAQKLRMHGREAV